MAQTIKLKRSATQNAVPSTSSLALGELAINTYDGKLFIKKSVSGTESIVTIGEVGANSIGPTELASTAVTAGSYGSTSAIPVITIDADGRITSASTATISGLSANSVTSTEIAANAVGISELDVSDGTDGQVLTTDGSGNLAFEDQSGGAASATAFSTNIASGDGSTTAFTLSQSPSAESKIIAFINGVFQNQDAYTISGTTLTFDTAPISGTNNVVVYVIGDVYSGESVLISNFSGDASTTAFTLANNPGNENNTQVYIDGVYQQKTTYSVSGTTLTFSSAPPTGTNNIEVVMLTSTTVNTPAAGSVVTASMADDSVTGAKIVSSAVTTAKIADSNVTTAKIADSNVTTAKIADSNVTTAKIANDAVTSAKIATLDANLEFGDSVKAIFGAGSDLQIYHDGTSSYIVNTTNDLIIKDDSRIRLRTPSLMVNNDADTENMIIATQNGSVDLYYDNDKKFETSSTGATVTGNLEATAHASVGGNLSVAGDLDITGNINSYNVTDLDVTDKTVTLGAGQSEALSGGSGIIIDGSNASLLWNQTNNRFDLSSDLKVGAEDSGQFSLEISGGATGTAEGGELRLNTATDYDGTYNHYRLDVFEDDFRIGRAGTTDLTINSSGHVGIGSDNPTDKVQILDSGNLALRVESTGAGSQSSVWTENNSGSINGMFMYGSSHSTYGAIGAGEGAFYSNTNINIMSDSSSGTIKFSTGSSGGSERMRITSIGNLQFTSQTTTFEPPGFTYHTNNYLYLRGGSSGLILSDDSGINTIQIIDGSNGYINFETSNGSSKMRIDSNGQVMIGHTSSFAHADADNLAIGNGLANSGLTIYTGSDKESSIIFGNSGTNGNIEAGIKYYHESHGTVANRRAMTFATGGSMQERMRINSSGQVGIACTDQSNPLTVDAKSASTTADSISVRNSGVATGNHTTGLRFQFNSAVSAAIRSRLTNTSSGAGTLSFYTSGDGSATNLAERMTINSSGQVQVSCVNNSYNFQAFASDSDSFFGVWDDSNNSANIQIDRSDGATVFYVMGHTGNYHFAGSDVSDRDLKENIEYIPNGSLELVKQLKPRTYNFKSSEGFDDSSRTGFIAQEVADVMTTDHRVASGTDGDKDMGIDPVGLIAHLTKAIQEQQTIIDDLKSRLDEAGL